MDERLRALVVLARTAAAVESGACSPAGVLAALGALPGITVPDEQTSLALPGAPSAPANALVRSAPAEVVRAIFDHWRDATGHPAAKLTPERERAIRARLRDGYSPAEIRAAIDGCATSRFHRGENDRGVVYDDLTLICRNGSKLEAFMATAPDVPLPTSAAPTGTDNEIEQLRIALRDATRRKDRDGYASINARLAAAVARRSAA